MILIIKLTEFRFTCDSGLFLLCLWDIKIVTLIVEGRSPHCGYTTPFDGMLNYTDKECQLNNTYPLLLLYWWCDLTRCFRLPLSWLSYFDLWDKINISFFNFFIWSVYITVIGKKTIQPSWNYSCSLKC